MTLNVYKQDAINKLMCVTRRGNGKRCLRA